MLAVGYALMFLGFFVAVAGEAMFLRVAYQRSLPWFFGCLFLPFVYLIFLCLNFRRTWIPLLIDIVGFLICLGGASLTGFQFGP